jgi:titin
MIKEIKPESAGTYTCRAENVAGSVMSTATINLQEIPWEETIELLSPTFIRKLSPVCVMDGESVNMTCIIQGKPIPKVEWFHDKKPIKEGKQITILQDLEGVCNLAINEVFPEDAGEYTCHAINVVGEAICTTSLIVEGIFFFVRIYV